MFHTQQPRLGPIVVSVLLMLASWPALCSAQTGPELLIKPWARDQIIEAEADASFGQRTHTDNAPSGGAARNASFTLDSYGTSGRVRFFPRDAGMRADPRFGYDVSYLDINTNDPHLPRKLTDESVAVGLGIGDFNGWLAGLTVGVGNASAGAFQDGNAYYGRADLLVGRELDFDSQLAFVIDYDGNRSFLPDVPLPGIVYRKTIDPTLLLAMGFPLTSVTWTPDKANTFNRQLTMEATYTIPDSLEANVDYALIDSAGPAGKVGLFLNYTDRTLPFHDNALAIGHDRIFFLQRRAEIGARWTPRPFVSVILAGGMAFDQRFEVGWDSKNYRRIAKAGDEPYARVGLEFRY